MSNNYPIDVSGRQIMPGDTLKVYHFTGRRKKKHYMYKYVKGVEHGRLVVSHLNPEGETYTLAMNGEALLGIEIVQGSVDGVDFGDRPTD